MATGTATTYFADRDTLLAERIHTRLEPDRSELDAGAHGGRRAVALLHHATDGLILDQLTLPEALGSPADAGTVAEQLARAVLSRGS